LLRVVRKLPFREEGCGPVLWRAELLVGQKDAPDISGDEKPKPSSKQYMHP
jgi:hypothetical protein